VLAPSARFARAHGRRHKALTERARQILLLVKRWLPDRPLVAVADSSYAAILLLDAVRAHLTMVTRLRLDARLFEPPPPRPPGTIGRPRVAGRRLPSLDERLHDPAAAWRRVEITGWYGRASRLLDIVSGTALWYHPGMRVPIRWVLVRDVAGEFEPQAFLCTDLEADPLDILRWFVRRWSVEVTFAEARRHLGLESQRQWSDKAIERTTPVLLGLYALWFDELMAGGGPPAHGASWCPKERLTFSDALAAVRHRIWTSTTSALSPDDADVMKVPRTYLDRLVQTACYPT
jgi:hypothetical protein